MRRRNRETTNALIVQSSVTCAVVIGSIVLKRTNSNHALLLSHRWLKWRCQIFPTSLTRGSTMWPLYPVTSTLNAPTTERWGSSQSQPFWSSLFFVWCVMRLLALSTCGSSMLFLWSLCCMIGCLETREQFKSVNFFIWEDELLSDGLQAMIECLAVNWGTNQIY